MKNLIAYIKFMIMIRKFRWMANVYKKKEEVKG